VIDAPATQDEPSIFWPSIHVKEGRMARTRVSMRKVSDVLRLKFEAGLSNRQIARSLLIARPTVAEYLRRFEAAELHWPEAAKLDEAVLEGKLFPPVWRPANARRPEPDWADIHQELRRKGVTKMLLWQEYRSAHPDGFEYSWFCDHYRVFRTAVDVVMRQTHRAGEKLFVDYAGQTVDVVERSTGEVREAQIFVAVLGASNYTFAEATWTQALPDWIGSHVRAFAFFEGVSEIVVPDNLKSGVRHPHRYEPDLNPTYQDMAAHYGVAILPARVRRPRDKAKVEVGVLLVERWILAALRDRTFFCLTELVSCSAGADNRAIAGLLERLNSRPFKKLPGSRREMFERLDQPALCALPATPYEYAEWRKARVNIDYHVAVEKSYYSVPYQLVRRQLDVRITARTVECLHRGKRVASHVRAHLPGQYKTVAEHMPKSHRAYAEWTPERLVRWATKAGPATAAVIHAILARYVHPQQGFRSCLGIMRLGKTYGAERLEAACLRVLAIGSPRYKSLESILRRGLDGQELPEQSELALAIDHDNVRGAEYFH
jgi:transposase